MIADLHVYELGDVMLLTMSGDVKDSVLAKLDQFIFTEDVQLGDVTDDLRADRGRRSGRGARGRGGRRPASPRTRCAALPEHGNLRGAWNGGSRRSSRA